VKVSVFENPEAVARRVAASVAEAIAGGARSLVLAGGSTPARAYELLAGMDLPWGRVTVLFGDERCVPPRHPDSNYLMVRRTLLDRVDPGGVERIPAELGAETAASMYGPVVRALGPLDMVLLGMGPDGHTASLFPGHPEVAAEGEAVAVHGAPKPPPDRVSLTLPVLRAARRVLIMATGAEKAGAVALARRGDVPAGMIDHADLLIDRWAAGG
jgi:6-phosphogluconolactonase